MTPPQAIPKLVKAVGAEPIPGYRLVSPLGRGGFGEVWKCEAPGGLFKAIKIVGGHGGFFPDEPSAADEEGQAIERIKAIRHPFLLSLERIERVGDHLVLVTELADTNLHQLLQEHQAAGRPGLPRAELLGYLAEAAEVLDLLNTEHGLQHLDIKPKNLFVVSRHVKVADFGLVTSLGRLQGGGLPALSLGALTPIYASPEAFQGTISPHSDQYSLAIVYQELLTGRLPFDGQTARQLLMQHTTVAPDLRPLPPGDRPAVARALAKVPEERFASCRAFVDALSVGGRATVAVPATPPRRPASPGGASALSGYHFGTCLERGPLSELWEARTPENTERLVKLVYGFEPRPPGARGEAVARLQGLAHPALAPVEVREAGPGQLALVSPRPTTTVREQITARRARGEAGLERDQALGWLREAAATLDALFDAHELPHLAVNPRALWLYDGRLRLADFGLVSLFWRPAGRSPTQYNPRYSAPELAERRPSRAADQYSLAVMYHEMITGALPQRRPGGLTLNAKELGPGENEALRRALDEGPQMRFPDATAFVAHLEQAVAAL